MDLASRSIKEWLARYSLRGFPVTFFIIHAQVSAASSGSIAASDTVAGYCSADPARAAHLPAWSARLGLGRQAGGRLTSTALGMKQQCIGQYDKWLYLFKISLAKYDQTGQDKPWDKDYKNQSKIRICSFMIWSGQCWISFSITKNIGSQTQ